MHRAKVRSHIHGEGLGCALSGKTMPIHRTKGTVLSAIRPVIREPLDDPSTASGDVKRAGFVYRHAKTHWLLNKAPLRMDPTPSRLGPGARAG